MTRTLSVWVGASIIYLYGTVNGEAATFTLVGDGEWQATVPRSEDDNYVVHLEAYSANGLEGIFDYTIYYGWMPVITDRTATDANRVRALRAKGWKALSPEEQEEWLSNLRGAYNASDLNRVGHNVDYLAEMLNNAGYVVEVEPKLNWIRSDEPTPEQMERYLLDVKALKEAFYGTTPLPESSDNMNYSDANNIEKLLEEIFTYINRMREGYRKCGTFRSGQGVILP